MIILEIILIILGSIIGLVLLIVLLPCLMVFLYLAIVFLGIGLWLIILSPYVLYLLVKDVIFTVIK